MRNYWRLLDEESFVAFVEIKKSRQTKDLNEWMLFETICLMLFIVLSSDVKQRPEDR